MARTPILNLSEISLTFGGDPLLNRVDLLVQPGDRLALVGRNGSGKSTLMKLMAGLVEPDSGKRSVGVGISVSYMHQDPDMSGFSTLGDFAISDLGPDQVYRAERAAEGLGFDASVPVATASGGEKRRAALAKILAEAPDLMLLDEPTNHLDITAIGWLEEELSQTRSAFVLISHDRAFLRRLTRATLWLDRGTLRRQDKGFEAFEAWRDKVWADEDSAAHKLKQKIKAEAKWAVEGISARRTRNQGRLRALQDLRQQRAQAIRRQGNSEMSFQTEQSSGRLVAEATSISKAFGDTPIVRDFSIRIMRGDRVALVGPNGVGKTTLLNMLIGRDTPDSGTVRLGKNLDISVFDQNRSALNPNATLWDSMTGAADLGVSGRADQVMVRGEPRHVVSYLRDFLFDEAQARAPVRSLSGGEKARLLLAQLMARPGNVLILDEPTNDLDVETLDLLQDALGDFDGTVIFVSHDRDFIDRIATLTVAFEGQGQATVYAGGWTDYQAQRQEQDVTSEKKTIKPKSVSSDARSEAKPSAGLTFTEKHRLAELPDVIDRLEKEIARLTDYLSAPDLFTTEPVKFKKATEALAERQQALSAAEEDWLTLDDKASAA